MGQSTANPEWIRITRLMLENGMNVRHNDAEGRYELDTDHGPATAAYARDGDTLIFTHTLVPRGEEGHGVGSALIAGAMADVRAAGLKVVPQCPFVANWFEHHPDQSDLLA